MTVIFRYPYLSGYVMVKGNKILPLNDSPDKRYMRELIEYAEIWREESNMKERESEKLRGFVPKAVGVRCPRCDSFRTEVVGKGRYRCVDCGKKFNLNESEEA